METLKDLLSKLNATSSEDDIKKVFEDIAEILLFNSHIKTTTCNYRILEIEFYFWNKNHKDDVTIKRNENGEPGMWWLHDYGVDLSLKCNIDNGKEEDSFYGGILIRSIGKLNQENEICDSIIFGPRKCCWELFYSSALEGNISPQIIQNKEGQEFYGDKGTTTRYITGKHKGIEGNYRFYIKEIQQKVESSYRKASPWE